MQVEIDVKANTALQTSKRAWIGRKIISTGRQEVAHALFYDVGAGDFLDQIYYHRKPFAIESRHPQTAWKYRYIGLLLPNWVF